MRTSDRMTRWNLWMFILISAGMGLLPVIKIFMVPGCMAFDATDDANHTFVNLFMARQSLQAGQFPLINLWNNFGTPILGDVLTYPWAAHAQTYWFFASDTAMAVNRFVLGALTTFLLIIYLRRFMSGFSACVGAVLVFLTPGFFWHFAHHHYQAAQLCFIVLLLAQDKFLRDTENRWLPFIGLCASFIFTFLNTSIHAVCLMIPFLLIHQLLHRDGWRLIKSAGFFLAMSSGVIFVGPELLHFAHLIGQSMRLEMGYTMAPHLTVAKRFSIPMAGFALWGAVLFWKRDSEGKLFFWRIVLLGFGPMVGVFMLLHQQELWQKLPLVKSTDISRLWWFSNLFLILGVGQCLDWIREKNIYAAWGILYGYLLIAVELCFRLFLKNSFFYNQKYIIFSFLLGVIVICGLRLARRETKDKSFVKRFCWAGHFWIIGSIIIFLQVACVATRILELQQGDVCRAGFYFTEKGEDVFTPRGFIQNIPAQTRVAVNDLSERGRDLKINRDLIFGSSGRSVILNKNFSHYLLEEKLIAPDNAPFAYHFSPPWRNKPLAELGIRFVMQRHDEEYLPGSGWRLVNSQDEWVLYEHPQKPTLVYLMDREEKITPLSDQDFEILGNVIQIKLSAVAVDGLDLVAAFTHLQGWKAFVDNKPREIHHWDNFLMHVALKEGDKVILLKYEPFTLGHFLLCAFLAIAFPVLCFKWLIIAIPNHIKKNE